MTRGLNDPPAKEGDSTASAPTGPVLPVASSSELLRGGKEVLIEHGGEFYRLRLTHSGKLILHK